MPEEIRRKLVAQVKTRLVTERTRYPIDDARAAVDFCATHLGFTVNPTASAIGITKGRARALVAAVVWLISPCAFGWLAHSRNSRLRLFTEDTPMTSAATTG